MPRYTVDYRFEHSSRSHAFELAEQHLSPHEAALHLIQLHFGDSENSVNMPNADATPDEILRQAEWLGISAVQVQALE
jgi:hypothetical protein